jgi:hypothetical protein
MMTCWFPKCSSISGSLYSYIRNINRHTFPNSYPFDRVPCYCLYLICSLSVFNTRLVVRCVTEYSVSLQQSETMFPTRRLGDEEALEKLSRSPCLHDMGSPSAFWTVHCVESFTQRFWRVSIFRPVYCETLGPITAVQNDKRHAGNFESTSEKYGISSWR